MLPLELTREELVSSLILQTPGPQPLSLQTLDTISEVAGAPPTPRETPPNGRNLVLSPLPSWPCVVSVAHRACRASVCTPCVLGPHPVSPPSHRTGQGNTSRGRGDTAACIVLSLGLAAQPGSPQMTTPRHRCSMAQSP